MSPASRSCVTLLRHVPASRFSRPALINTTALVWVEKLCSENGLSFGRVKRGRGVRNARRVTHLLHSDVTTLCCDVTVTSLQTGTSLHVLRVLCLSLGFSEFIRTEVDFNSHGFGEVDVLDLCTLQLCVCVRRYECVKAWVGVSLCVTGNGNTEAERVCVRARVCVCVCSEVWCWRNPHRTLCSPFSHESSSYSVCVSPSAGLIVWSSHSHLIVHTSVVLLEGRS